MSVLRLWLLIAALGVVVMLAFWEVVASGRAAGVVERVFGARDLTRSGERIDGAVNASFVQLGIVDVASESEPRKEGRDTWPHWEKRGRIPGGVGLVECNLTITRAVRSAGGRVVRARERGPDWRGLSTLDMQLGVSGRETHRVVLKQALPREESSAAASGAASNGDVAPRIAILIDDLGYSHSSVIREFIKIDDPISFSVLPHCPRTTEIADAVRQAGKDLLLHLPMQPEDWPDTDAGDGVLLTEHSHDEIRSLVASALESVPNVVGVNNHMGSAFTKDRARMRTVMSAIGGRGLFFVDSMTTPQSVGLAEAGRAGIPTARNYMFIDSRLDELGELDVASQLDALAGIARRRGSAIGIGHPRGGTLRALRRALPRLKETGIEIVPVSDLVR